MIERHRIARSLVWLLLLVAPFAQSQPDAKKKVSSQADLPRFSYPVTGSASALVQADDATFNGFAAKVRADLDSVFRDYAIDDKSTLRTLLSAKLDLQELAGDYPGALETIVGTAATWRDAMQARIQALADQGVDVFDHDYRVSAGKTHKYFRCTFCLVVRHACYGFVDQQHARLLR